jgi:uncharacterized membrane protein
VSYAPGSYFVTILNYIILFIDISAAIVIGVSVLRAIIAFLGAQKLRSKDQGADINDIKRFLISGLIIGIDLEVGADILRTILVPSLNDLLALAVVVALRVVLNWSLEAK